MTQYMNNMKIGDTLDFVGPKGRLIYQRNGKFLIRPLKLSDQPSNVQGKIFATNSEITIK